MASLIGPGLYEEFALDYDRRMVEYIHSHGALVKLHICGNIKALLPLLQQVAPDILDVDWMVDFKLAVDTFRGKPTSVCGNLDPVAVFLQSTVEELRQSVQSAIRVSDETTFIAGGCEIPVDTPAENLYEMNRLLYR